MKYKIKKELNNIENENPIIYRVYKRWLFFFWIATNRYFFTLADAFSFLNEIQGGYYGIKK